MTYPRWATERSDEAAAGRDLTDSSPAARPPARWWQRPVRHRFLLVLALVLVALILAIFATEMLSPLTT